MGSGPLELTRARHCLHVCRLICRHHDCCQATVFFREYEWSPPTIPPRQIGNCISRQIGRSSHILQLRMTLYPWRWVSSLVFHETRIEDTSLEPALRAPYQSVYSVMAGKASSDQCVPAVESSKRKGELTSKQCAFRITTRLTQEPAETEMSGNTQRSRPNGSSPSARSTEVLEETGRSSFPKGAHSLRSDNPSCSQTGTAPPSWKDVLKLAIWRLLPPEHPGLSPTEVHDRLENRNMSFWNTNITSRACRVLSMLL
jgi:hypothetical protein